VADYSIVNLRSGVENSAPKFGLPDTFEAHFAKNALDAKDLGVSLQRLAGEASSPFGHRHREQPEELYVVVSGSGTIRLDDEEQPLSTWDVVHVNSAILRSFTAGPDGLEYLAFGRIHPSGDAEIVQPDQSQD
jgi:uncharacterized cupin superfamily protein